MPVTELDQMMDEIHRLAPTVKHNLAPYLLDGRPLTYIQASLVLGKLQAASRLTEDQAAEPLPARREAQAAPEGKVPPPLAAFKTMPAGYYAVRRGDTAVIDYFLIEPGKGKWEGLMFARRVLGGQAKEAKKLRTERMENMQMRVAMQRIMESGLEAAAALFADTLERCIHCSTPLTNDLSRSRRKGDHCFRKYGP